MTVQVLGSDGEVMWQRGKETGMTSRAYTTDGTQQEIIKTLRNALEQAEVELAVAE